MAIETAAPDRSAHTAGHSDNLMLLYALLRVSAHADFNKRQIAMMLLLQAEIVPPTIGATAEVMRVPKSAAVRAVNGLELKGMATRKPSKTDKRIVTVHLTSKGRSFAKSVVAAMRSPPTALQRPTAISG